jgi:hypothetical protein
VCIPKARKDFKIHPTGFDDSGGWAMQSEGDAGGCKRPSIYRYIQESFDGKLKQHMVVYRRVQSLSCGHQAGNSINSVSRDLPIFGLSAVGALGLSGIPQRVGYSK